MSAPDSVEATAPVADAAVADAAAVDGPADEADTVDSAGGVDALDALIDASAPETRASSAARAASAAHAARWADADAHATALTWVDPVAVADARPAAEADARPLFAGAHLRPAISRPGVLAPFGVLVGLVAVYAGATLMCPLTAVAPTVQTTEFTATAAPPATIAWPSHGSAAVGIEGIGTVASTTETSAIASLTKIVSAMMVLEALPLAPGEQGPSFSFTRADSQEFMTYLRSDQSALDVPVDGSLTEYQMLQGVLLGSANNYIDRLADEIWGSREAFAEAADAWLSARGITGVTIKTPSGFDERNVATPDAMIAAAEVAMQNPVFAEIVGTRSVELPGAGLVTNTNGMLDDDGVVGVKTGTLHESWNLLTAKDVRVGDTTVRLYASVLSQVDNESRLTETRALFAQLESALQGQAPVVPKGVVVGTVDTLWGPPVEIVTDAVTDVVLWNGAATTTVSFDLGERRAAGDEVGTLTASGPLNSTTTPLALAEEIEEPSAWWRLTHPLELLGLAGE
ncbi:D-alanyl-D-alanine carboxypeptidase family protein [Microbacterium sp.]|uniref:D-alanyl-D-alanine carboxypeptidase family protein n=1 Tax=Microbacterium sp. TaxID=51671 RepID=UPI0039E513CE